jgi:hypothetical protein
MTATPATAQAGADSISPALLMRLLEKTIPSRMPTLIVGAPGIGKTDVVAEASARAKYELMVSHPVVADPTDAKGLPWPMPDKGSAQFLPFGDLQRALSTKDPLVWFLDDLGQATPAVQASYMQLILGRQINGHKLNDNVTFIAATNRRTDRAGVTGILEPVKSRFGVIIHLHPNIKDWVNWALTHDVAPEVIAFLRFRPEKILDFKATADIVNQPCPRTWKHASDVIKLSLGDDLELAALQGAIGRGAAGELEAYLRIYRELPDLDSIIANPEKAVIPKNLNARYAVSTGLATKANPNNFERVLRYAERMSEEANGAEFAVLLVRDCDRRDAKIQHTPAWTRMCADTEMGRLISGDDD